MPSKTTRTITLSGPDAITFAHAQLSSDVLALPVGRWQWSGWLDPKGRVRVFLQAARVGDDRLVLVPRGGDAEAIAADLKRFVFRAKVQVQVSEPMHIADGEAATDGEASETHGTLTLGEGDAALRIGANDGDNAWIARHIRKGFPWLPDAALNALLPPALSMERLGAIAFAKGCFPGQEIAARLHFLGGHKRHLRLARSDDAWSEGESVRIDGKDAGIVLMHETSPNAPTTLVVLDDAIAQAETLESEGKRLHLLSTFAE